MNTISISATYSFSFTAPLAELLGSKGYAVGEVAKEIERRGTLAIQNGDRKVAKAGSKAANKPEVTIARKGKSVVGKVAGQAFDLADSLDIGTAKLIQFNADLEALRDAYSCPVVLGRLPHWLEATLLDYPAACRKSEPAEKKEPATTVNA